MRAIHREHLIVLTAWLYGHHGSNFVKTMLRLARERQVLQVVHDQHGCPTWTRDLAGALTAMCQRLVQARDACPWGTYHFCGAGQTTWYGFARAIFEEVRPSSSLQIQRVEPIPTTAYHSGPATTYSVLDCPKIKRRW
jgi:dTDP-4-dehydrorhamnose reductase